MHLIEAIQAEAQEARGKALVAYREILQRDADPRPNDAKRLREAMAVLGYAPSRLENDLRVLQRAAVLDREAADADSRELTSMTDSVGAAIRQYRAETDALVRKRESEQSMLDSSLRTLVDRLAGAREAKRKLVGLRQANRDLFRPARAGTAAGDGLGEPRIRRPAPAGRNGGGEDGTLADSA